MLHDRTVADDKVGPSCGIVRYQLNFCIRGSHDLQWFQISMFMSDGSAQLEHVSFVLWAKLICYLS